MNMRICSGARRGKKAARRSLRLKYAAFPALALSAMGWFTAGTCAAQDSPAPTASTPARDSASPAAGTAQETTPPAADALQELIRKGYAPVQPPTAAPYRNYRQTPESNALSFSYQLGSTYGGAGNYNLSKKARGIMILRQILALKLSQRDLETVLPLLKNLRDTERLPPVKPEQALDDEYQKLLEARPGDPLPPSSAALLRDEAEARRLQKQAIWDRMQKALGREKTEGIRQMLNSESLQNLRLRTIPVLPGNQPRTFFSVPTAPAGAAGIPGPRPEANFPGIGPGSALPGGPALEPAIPGEAPAAEFPRPVPEAGSPDNPISGDPESTAPVVPGDRSEPEMEARPPAVSSGQTEPALSPGLRLSAQAETNPEAGGTSPLSPGTTRPAVKARSGSNRNARKPAAAPDAGSEAAGGYTVLTQSADVDNRVRVLYRYSLGQVSLDELIDIIEQKLAAMKHQKSTAAPGNALPAAP